MLFIPDIHMIMVVGLALHSGPFSTGLASVDLIL
jgi:hypothetical protein